MSNKRERRKPSKRPNPSANVRKIETQSGQPPQLPPQITQAINEKIETAFRMYILPLRHLIDSRHKQIETWIANLIATQNILENKKILLPDEYKAEVARIVRGGFGQVQEGGVMEGYCSVEMYNMGGY